ATLGLGAPGFAESPTPVVPSAVVSYSDLDLSTSAGIHTLYERIRIAAWQVCRQSVPVRHGPGAIEILKCRDTLTDVAVGRVNKPALTALHTGKKPREITASRYPPHARQ
ncbi:MAG TPA: UrcA family protein, partial [Steroidobacteraceae bacterium]|nr:UrcA family protein [Steroidobacteraceae bacterium]